MTVYRLPIRLPAKSAPVPVPDVHLRSVRVGDEAFFDGSVAFMASQLRHDFRTDLGPAVMESAALLKSIRQTSFESPELLSVRQAWSAIDHSSWRGQLKACLLYTSPSPRDKRQSRMPSSA